MTDATGMIINRGMGHFERRCHPCRSRNEKMSFEALWLEHGIVLTRERRFGGVP